MTGFSFTRFSQRSGIILVHAARHCTAKLLEFTTLRGAVGITAYAARLPSLVQYHALWKQNFIWFQNLEKIKKLKNTSLFQVIQHSRRRRGGGAWGAVAPPFGSKRRKFEQIVSSFGHTSGEKPSQFRQRNRLIFRAKLNASQGLF